MGRRRPRLVPPGTRAPRILDSARGKGPDDDDLLAAYAAILYRIGPGHEGGSLYVGRSGSREVVIGIDTDHSDPSGDGEVIFHGEWRR
jgi:hypothetical protein